MSNIRDILSEQVEPEPETDIRKILAPQPNISDIDYSLRMDTSKLNSSTWDPSSGIPEDEWYAGGSESEFYAEDERRKQIINNLTPDNWRKYIPKPSKEYDPDGMVWNTIQGIMSQSRGKRTALMKIPSTLNLFGAPEWLGRKGAGRGFEEMEDLVKADRYIQSVFNLYDPFNIERGVGLTGATARTIGEFAVPAATAGKIIKGVKGAGKLAQTGISGLRGTTAFGLHGAMTFPTEEQSALSFTDYLGSKSRELLEQSATGGVVGALGPLIPKTTVRAPVVITGFAGKTYLETGSVEDALETAAQIAVFEIHGGIQRGAAKKKAAKFKQEMRKKFNRFHRQGMDETQALREVFNEVVTGLNETIARPPQKPSEGIPTAKPGRIPITKTDPIRAGRIKEPVTREQQKKKAIPDTTVAKDLATQKETIPATIEEIAGSKISVKPQKEGLKQRLWDLAVKTDAALIDRKAPLINAMIKADIILDPKKEGGLDPAKNPVELLTMYEGKEGGRAYGFVMYHTSDVHGNKTGPSLEEVIRPVARSWQKFELYAMARTDLMRWGQGKNPGFDMIYDKETKEWKPNPDKYNPDVARALVEKYDSPVYRETADSITQWCNRVLDYAVQSKALSPEKAAKFKKANPQYLPLFREMDGEYAAVNGTMAVSKPFKKMKGSELPRIELMQNLLTFGRSIISTSNKVHVSTALADLMKVYPKLAENGIIREVKKPNSIIRITLKAKEIADDINKKKKKGTDIDLQQLGFDPTDPFVFFRAAKKVFPKGNIVPVIRETKPAKDGKPAKYKTKLYKVDPDVYKILQNMDHYQLPGFLNATLGAATRMVRLGATGLNPKWSLWNNFWRDGMTALFTAEHARYGPFSSVRGIAGDLTRSVKSQIFMGAGGGLSGQVTYDRIQHAHLKSEILNTAGKRYIRNTLFHPVTAARKIFGVTELGPRIAEFEAGLKEGESRYGAGSPSAMVSAFNAAQDVTLNFTRAGTLGRILNQMVPFHNAAVQAPDKIIRTYIKHPKRMTAMGMSYALANLGLWWLNKDEEFYENMDDRERANYYYFKIPKWIPGLGGEIVRIPQPYELGYLFGSIVVAAANVLYRKDKDAFVNTWDSFFSQIVPPAYKFPLVSEMSFAKPYWEVATNKDWLGRDIVSPGQGRKIAPDQYKAYTNRLIRLSAQKMYDLTGRESVFTSPLQLEHLVNSYTGGLANRLYYSLESPFQWITGEQEFSPAQIPALGGAFVRDPYFPRRQVQKFYEKYGELERKMASMKAEGREMTDDEILDASSMGRLAREVLPSVWDLLQKTKKKSERRRIYLEIKDTVGPYVD